MIFTIKHLVDFPPYICTSTGLYLRLFMKQSEIFDTVVNLILMEELHQTSHSIWGNKWEQEELYAQLIILMFAGSGSHCFMVLFDTLFL